MKELTLKRRLNTYLYRGYPGISSNFENSTKQLEAQLENGVAYKKTCNRHTKMRNMYTCGHSLFL